MGCSRYQYKPFGTQTDTDSVIGWVSDTTNETTVVDQTSSLQSQPNRDATQNVILLSGSQQDGITSIQYRRPLISPDVEGDTDIWNTPTTSAWAVGDIDPRINANSDALVYSQHSSMGRSDTVSFLFRENGPAVTSGILATDADYRAEWISDVDDDTIIVRMSAPTNGWVGFGVSNNPSGHSQTDSAVAWVQNGGATQLFDDTNVLLTPRKCILKLCFAIRG